MKKTGRTAIVASLVLAACTTPGVNTAPFDPGAGSLSQAAAPGGIPNEYIPKPGWCRVWFPDREPPDQPPPERCLEIPEVPPGAWLVYGGTRIRTYRIEEHHPGRAGTVKTIHYFEQESGRLLRQEKVCE